MSDINDAFWHKGQRDIIVNQPLGKLNLAMNGDEQMSWSAIPVMINGAIYTLTADAVGADTVPVTGQLTAGLHANNPVLTITDDSSSSVRTVRQNFLSLSVAALSQVYCIVTISGTPTNIATTRAGLHFYAGEIVLNTATAKRPVLDLSAECPIAQILYVNTTSSALAVGAGGSAELMGGGTSTAGSITDIGRIPSD
jgi:hypothetical protein